MNTCCKHLESRPRVHNIASGDIQKMGVKQRGGSKWISRGLHVGRKKYEKGQESGEGGGQSNSPFATSSHDSIPEGGPAPSKPQSHDSLSPLS